PLLGLLASAAIAALLHFVVGAAGMRGMRIFASPELGPGVPAARLNHVVLAVVALAGLCITLNAAVWTRSLAPAAGTSLWSYVSIAAIFCIGLAGGFALAAWQAPTVRYPGLSLALVGLLAGAFSVGGLFALPLLPRWYVLMLRASGDSAVLFHAGTMAIFGLVLVPVAMLLGATFRLALRCLDGESRAS